MLRIEGGCPQLQRMIPRPRQQFKTLASIYHNKLKHQCLCLPCVFLTQYPPFLCQTDGYTDDLFHCDDAGCGLFPQDPSRGKHCGTFSTSLSHFCFSSDSKGFQEVCCSQQARRKHLSEEKTDREGSVCRTSFT